METNALMKEYRILMNTYRLTGIEFYRSQAQELRKVIEFRIGAKDEYEGELAALAAEYEALRVSTD